MNVFYHPDLEPASVASAIRLNEEESAHCTRVLRMQPGSSMALTDGKGHLFKGSLVSADSRHCLVNIESFIKTERHPYYLHVAIAPTKNIDRFEFFLEKAAEIGIDEITPLICFHSERTTLRTDRLRKVLVAAMKQSRNLYLPELNEPLSFQDLMKGVTCRQKFIGYVEEQQELFLKDACKPAMDTIVLIGPEGDFSRQEFDEAVRNGYTAVSLGHSRLRTETAGIVTCMTLSLLNL